MHVLAVDKIDFVEAQDDYVCFKCEGKDYLKDQTMGALEAQLDPARFVRIHRSVILNVARIAELRPQLNREYTVVLRDGTQLRLSRSYRDRLDARLGEPR